MVDACERLVDDLVRGREGNRLKAGSYVFDPDFDRDVIIKWEGDTDVVHGVEPCAHLSPGPRSVGPRSPLPRADVDFVGSDAPILFTEKLNLKRPEVGGHNPLHQDYPYWVGVARGPGAGRDLDAVPRRGAARQRLPAGRTRQPRSGVWQTRADDDQFATNEIDGGAYEDVESVPLELPAGSVVMFGSYLVHHSAPEHVGGHRGARCCSATSRPARRTCSSRSVASVRRTGLVTDTTLRPATTISRRGARRERVAGHRVARAERHRPVSPAGPRASGTRPTGSATCRPGRRGRCAGRSTRCGRRSSPTSGTRSSPPWSGASRTSPEPRTTAWCCATRTRTSTPSGPTSTSSSPSAWPVS